MTDKVPAFVDSESKVVVVSTNVNDVENASSLSTEQASAIVYQLNPVTFNFPNEQQIQYDLLANEVATIIPEAVIGSAQAPNYIKYQSLISLLIGTVKEQKKQIDELKNQHCTCLDQIKDLKSQHCDKLTQLESSVCELFIRIK